MKKLFLLIITALIFAGCSNERKEFIDKCVAAGGFPYESNYDWNHTIILCRKD